ncbi:MAG: polyphosphate kinase 1 [Cytophagales bacterium]|nr:polyphosphate kinase 1 [Cytophagales bacterium]
MQENYQDLISGSDLISRDLSWVRFNYRVLDQVKKQDRSLVERLKFLAITASNADEFFMIRVGSLYNYVDFETDRIDYSGLHLIPFKNALFQELQEFAAEQHRLFSEDLSPKFKDLGFSICAFEELSENEQKQVGKYFRKEVFPMLTPMMYDSYHPFPVLMNNVLTFGVVSKGLGTGKKEKKKMSFVQIPQNVSRFYPIEREGQVIFVPIEEIVKNNIAELFKNVELISCTLFRMTRNGDFTLEESEDIEANYLEELSKKLKTRKTGRVVRLEISSVFDKWLIRKLKDRFEIEDVNLFKAETPAMIDYTGLWQIVNYPALQNFREESKPPVKPLSMEDYQDQKIFNILKDRDILLHQPYNSIEPLLDLLDQAAEDANVMSIKLTIYRLAKRSRVIEALLKAAENGKHVSVLFEVKARFDEENNMRQAQRLQKAGCFVIYGVGSLKTHTKLLLIVRKERDRVKRYVHMSSGNYNESTSKLYTDLGFMTTDDGYANDVQEFFNVITGHSFPDKYENLLTAPRDLRNKLIELIQSEGENAANSLPAGIVIKINSLQDKDTIEALYAASQLGVPVRLIVRGICCLRPQRAGLSENIEVRSIVGDYLEHSRIFYFHNNGEPIVYSGSADVMVRSFDRRLESLFLIKDKFLKQQAINILAYNLKDNVNAYEMKESGSYVAASAEGEVFNIHKEFFKVTSDIVRNAKLFG